MNKRERQAAQKFLAEAGAKGGRAKTEAKREAARKNSAKARRARRLPIGTVRHRADGYYWQKKKKGWRRLPKDYEPEGGES